MMKQGDCVTNKESQTSTQKSVLIFKESKMYAVPPCVRALLSEHDRNQI